MFAGVDMVDYIVQTVNVQLFNCQEETFYSNDNDYYQNMGKKRRLSYRELNAIYWGERSLQIKRYNFNFCFHTNECKMKTEYAAIQIAQLLDYKNA